MGTGAGWAPLVEARGVGAAVRRGESRALVVRGDALNQVWLFIVAPLVGGALAAVVQRFVLYARAEDAARVAGGVEPSDVIVS